MAEYKCIDKRCEALNKSGHCNTCGGEADPVPSVPAQRPNRPEDVALHAVKFDGDKPQMELVPPSAMTAMGKVLGYGASKYARHNYLKGMAWTRLVGAALRHLFSWLRGEELDPESKLPHLYHALASIAMLIETIELGKGLDDRYKDPSKGA